MRPWTLLYYRPLPQGSLFLTHLLNIPSQKLQVSRRPQGSLVISVLHTSRPSQCRPHTDDGSEDVWAKVFQKPSHSTTATTYPHGSFISTTLRKQRSLSSSWCHMDCLRRFFGRHTPRVMCFCEDATLLQSGSSSLSPGLPRPKHSEQKRTCEHKKYERRWLPSGIILPASMDSSQNLYSSFR